MFAPKYLQATPYQYNGPKLSPFLFIRRVNQFTWELQTNYLGSSKFKNIWPLLRNRVFTYSINNQYIETHYQKHFIPGLSGTLGHIAEMSHIINQENNNGV